MLSLPSSEMLGVATIGQRKRTPSLAGGNFLLEHVAEVNGETRTGSSATAAGGATRANVIRRVLLTGTERLNDRGVHRMALGLRLGDPNDEVLGAWRAQEYVRDVYFTEDPRGAGELLYQRHPIGSPLRRGARDPIARTHAQASATEKILSPSRGWRLEWTDRGDEPRSNRSSAQARASRSTATSWRPENRCGTGRSRARALDVTTRTTSGWRLSRDLLN